MITIGTTIFIIFNFYYFYVYLFNHINCLFIVKGPAPESVTNSIFELTKNITSYKIVPDLKCSIDYCGLQYFKV